MSRSIPVTKPATAETKRTPTETLIRLDHVSRVFTTNGEEMYALKDVTCNLVPRALNIITGPSGSGKSTMLDTVVGLQPPSQGKVTVLGEDIYSMTTDERAYYRARMLGMVYQANYWVRSLSVLENVAMPLWLSGYDREQAAMLAELSLDAVEMSKYAHSYPTFLSGGQQQRVSMARALVANPEIVVADEPTGNLDTRNGSLIMDLLVSCVKDRGKSVILVTHNLGYLPLGDNNIYLKDGILTEGLSNDEITSSLSSTAPGPAATQPSATISTTGGKA